jgi:hypothetical protein
MCTPARSCPLLLTFLIGDVLLLDAFDSRRFRNPMAFIEVLPCVSLHDVDTLPAF